jgi:hypothetical protein
MMYTSSYDPSHSSNFLLSINIIKNYIKIIILNTYNSLDMQRVHINIYFITLLYFLLSINFKNI